MKRLACLLGAILALYGASVLASSTPVGRALVPFLTRHPNIAKKCGPPRSYASWPRQGNLHGYIVHQKFRKCELTAIYFVDYPVTPKPTPKPTATSTPAPTNTPTPSTPEQFLLSLINQERASHGYGPLQLSQTQSAKALIHSQDMVATGTIWHENSQYPQENALTGTEFVVPWTSAGENVGVDAQGSTLADLRDDFQQMINEPWTAGCTDDHHCNIDSLRYTSVGIGIASGSYSGFSATYVTEDFTG